MLAAREAIDRLRAGELKLPPLSIKVVEAPASTAGLELDALVRLGWQDTSFTFGVQYTARSTPKALRNAIFETQAVKNAGLNPLILAPYLSEQRLDELEARGVSGLDLCGNGIVIVPPKLLVRRSGAPNQFRESQKLKNVYSGASSLIARVFLSTPLFTSVQAVEREIRRRGGAVSLSTVSKALKLLEEDLIIARDAGRISLIQPKMLLSNLAENYRPPVIRKRFIGKLETEEKSVIAALERESGRKNLRLALTGAGSTGYYATMARGETLQVYCDGLDALLADLETEETRAFPSLEVVETNDAAVYFDLERRDGYPVASPVQTYLELMRGDKRERETAEQVEEQILRPKDPPR
jgi:hypothetical protein